MRVCLRLLPGAGLWNDLYSIPAARVQSRSVRTDPGLPILRLWTAWLRSIFPRVHRLTKQEQMVLCVILGLLLVGWAVKTYRTAHPPTQAADQLEP